MKMLLDRDEQIQALFEAYERCCSQTSNERTVVKIYGNSGAGKTALAMQLKNRVMEDGGYFVTAKFDQLSLKIPTKKELYKPFVEAFSDICNQVSQTESRASLVKDALHAALSKVELCVLQDVLATAMGAVLGPRSGDSVLSGRVLSRGLDAQERCFHVVSTFVVAAATEWPLVILLDDVHWSNANSAQLFAFMASNRAPNRLLLVCTYSDDALDHSNEFSTIANELKGNGVTFIEIEATSVSKEAIGAIVSDRLQVAKNKLVPLGDVISYKTKGNALFASLMFDVLLRENMVSKDTTGRWSWDEGQIIQDFEAQTLVQLALRVIGTLPPGAQELLKIASCLGSSFNENVLWSAANMRKQDVSSFFQLILQMGLVVQILETGEARFAHDKFQEAAYSLIPERERPSFHLGVGQRLLHWLSADLREKYQILIVHQIGCGIDLLDDAEEKAAYAELYFRAGKEAAIKSEFLASAALLKVGINLLGRYPFRDHYNISLRLHNELAEVEYYNGNLDSVDMITGMIIKHSHNVNDAFLGHFTKIYSTGARGEIATALDEGLSVLAKLDEKIPRKAGPLQRRKAWFKCRRLLRNKSDDEVLNLPRMRNPKSLSAMRLLILVTSFAYYVREELMPTLIARMIEMTLKLGINDMSCVSFGLLSFVSAARGEYDQADRFGNLAMIVCQHLEAHDFETRVTLCVHAGVYPLTHPLRESLQPLLDGHRSGLVFGDIHVSLLAGFYPPTSFDLVHLLEVRCAHSSQDGMNCAMAYVAVLLRCGTPLPQLVEEIEPFRQLCSKYSINTMAPFCNCIMQLAQNFMGRSDDPLVLTGDFFDEGETLQTVKMKYPVPYLTFLHLKHFLAVYFNELPRSLDILKQTRHLNIKRLLPFAVAHHMCLVGLAAARLSRSVVKHKRRALHCLTQLRRFAGLCPENFQNAVYLVEAELASGAGNHQDALIKFDLAIEQASEGGRLHEEGLANEGAGRMLHDIGRLEESREYFRRAISCYERWGANAKVSQIVALLEP